MVFLCPHNRLSNYPGRTEEQKIRVTEAITKNVVEIANCPEDTVSLAIEEISPEQWDEKVYKPDILNKEQLLQKDDGQPFITG